MVTINIYNDDIVLVRCIAVETVREIDQHLDLASGYKCVDGLEVGEIMAVPLWMKDLRVGDSVFYHKGGWWRSFKYKDIMYKFIHVDDVICELDIIQNLWGYGEEDRK